MIVSRSQAREVLRLLLFVMAADERADPGELEAVRAALRALDGRLATTNLTRAIEALGELAAAGLAVEHTELVWACLMAGLDAIIAQGLASGANHQHESYTHEPNLSLNPVTPLSI